MEQPRKLDSGKWQARYTGPDGKRHTAGTHATKRAAQVAAAKALADISRGSWTPEEAGSIRFAAWAEKVMAAHASEAQPITISNYRGHLKNHILPTFGTMRVRDIKPTDVRIWWNSLADRPSRRSIYHTMSLVMRYAVNDDLIVRSPCRISTKAEVRRQEQQRRPYLTVEQFWSIYDQSSPQLQAFLMVALGGGLRLGEVLGLDRDAVDLKTGLLDVKQQSARTPGGHEIKPGTKNHSTRRVTLPQEALEVLRAHMRANPAIGSVPVFTGPSGSRWYRGAVYREWHAARAAVGLEWAHIHDIRATSLTEFLRGGGTVADVMARAGHKDFRSALTYQHSDLKRDAELAKNMGQALRRAQ